MSSDNVISQNWIEESNYEKYLLNFLSPTSIGTQYWESPPPGNLTDRQVGRILLQVHQLVERINKSTSLFPISFLDIGTGNGFIPRLLPYFVDIAKSHGCDPFLEGEHITGFQIHNRDKEFDKIVNKLFMSVDENNILTLNQYSENTSSEHFFGAPAPIKINKRGEDDGSKYRFYQVGADNLDSLENLYNFLYCKAIEHIHNWENVFQQAYKVSSEGGVFYLKHKSFFSYLGAHRYGAVGIPWGHLRMNSEQYDNYVETLHPQRAESIKNFYYQGLSFPRNTISEMIEIAFSQGWKLGSIEYERSNHIEKFEEMLFSNNSKVYKEIKNNYDVSVDELLSGLIHIIFTK